MGGRGVQVFLWAMNRNVKREKKCGETDDFHVLTACLYCKRVSYSATTKAPRPMLSRTSMVRRGRWWIPLSCRWRRHRMRHGLLWDGLPVWPKHHHRLALEQTELLRIKATRLSCLWGGCLLRPMGLWRNKTTSIIPSS